MKMVLEFLWKTERINSNKSCIEMLLSVFLPYLGKG